MSQWHRLSRSTSLIDLSTAFTNCHVMRLLFAIPHFFPRRGPSAASEPDDFPATSDPRSGPGRATRHGSTHGPAELRAAKLAKTVTSLHQHLGGRRGMIRIADRTVIPADEAAATVIDVLIVTNAEDHLIAESGLSPDRFRQVIVDAPPMHLGFAAQRTLARRIGEYEFYAYLEDDLVIHDPWFFRKLTWFTRQVGDDKLLQPHRYEVGTGKAVDKVYIDGDLKPHVAGRFQDVGVKPSLEGSVLGSRVRFVRPLNPHSGCFFLTGDQMSRFAGRPDFGVATGDFVGPLETAATLGVMRCFSIYKPEPAMASFLEIQHQGTDFLDLIQA